MALATKPKVASVLMVLFVLTSALITMDLVRRSAAANPHTAFALADSLRGTRATPGDSAESTTWVVRGIEFPGVTGLIVTGRAVAALQQ
jgi:2-keto-4-pentenoate hydratase